MYHTPHQSAVLLTAINALSPIKFTMFSHHNDVCDSAVSGNDGITIYFPNITDVIMETAGDEKYDYFCVRFGDEEYIDTGFTLLELVALLNSFDRLVAIKEPTMTEANRTRVFLLEFIKANYDHWDVILKPVVSLNIGDYIVLDMGAGGKTEIERLS